jgi:DNA/RNA-binding domain of Phe-tRNA-synthetase-like protein
VRIEEREEKPVAEPIVPDVAQEIAGLVRLGLVQAEPVAVREAGTDLTEEMEDLARVLADKCRGLAPAQIPGLAPARDLYRAVGVDPTRTRPSSEALLRRVVQARPLPRILNAVDVCNLCSLQFLLPLGLYDVAKIRGRVRLRRGLPGESFAGIRKEDVHVGGRFVLADDEGAFGNPTSDSMRTSVDARTRSLWLVIFAPYSYSPGLLAEHVAFAQHALCRHLAPEDEVVRAWGTLIPPEEGRGQDQVS